MKTFLFPVFVCYAFTGSWQTINMMKDWLLSWVPNCNLALFSFFFLINCRFTCIYQNGCHLFWNSWSEIAHLSNIFFSDIDKKHQHQALAKWFGNRDVQVKEWWNQNERLGDWNGSFSLWMILSMHSGNAANCQTQAVVCEELEGHYANPFIQKDFVPTGLDTVLSTKEINSKAKSLPSGRIYSR